MYLLALDIRNARRSGDRAVRIDRRGERLRKWTLLSSGPESAELLRVAALVCCGARFAPGLGEGVSTLCEESGATLQVGYRIARHCPQDRSEQRATIVGSTLRVEDHGAGLVFLNAPKDLPLPGGTRPCAASVGTGNTRQFSVALGPDLNAHKATDDFEFIDPGFRASRYASLFDAGARVTDPIELLERLHYRAVWCGRLPAKQTLETVCCLFAAHLAIDTGFWREKAWDPRGAWWGLRRWQQRAALPALDLVRHMMDAFPKSAAPLEMPGVLLLDRPERCCTAGRFPAWAAMMDRMFPNMQVLASLPARAIESLPGALRRRRLALPESPPPVGARGASGRPRLARGSVLLVDIDGKLPNLALMKLSAHFKAQGRKVVLDKKEALYLGVEEAYASCVFSRASSQQRVERLRNFYGDALVVGGSGVDLALRLPREIEERAADYTLYPELQDRAMGFLTRGCPLRCPFCLVPQKEGGVRLAEDLDSLLQGRRKLILLDDNILAHPRAGDLLEQMVQRDVAVNFTQTLDLRMLGAETAAIVKRIVCSNTRFTRRVYHFSLNGVSGLSRLRESYARFGFGPADNVEFVCMYGFHTTLRQDVRRFRFIRSLPGAYVFVQEYQPVLGAGPAPRVEFFDGQADELIDQLLQITYTQNMKSMERYYGWLSRAYARRFGRLHQGLVDTLFRYNHRDRKGRYIATLAGTRPLS